MSCVLAMDHRSISFSIRAKSLHLLYKYRTINFNNKRATEYWKEGYVGKLDDYESYSKMH
jgi:hypothetical protein